MKKTLSLLILIPSLLFVNNSTAKTLKTGTAFKDWIVACQIVAQTKKKHCHIAQTTNNKKGNKMVLHTMVGKLPGQKKAVVIFTLPKLINLDTKIRLIIDSKFETRFSLKQCNKKTKSCHSGFPIGKKLLRAFKKGKVAYFTYKRGEKDVRIPISLRGFTAGLRAL